AIQRSAEFVSHVSTLNRNVASPCGQIPEQNRAFCEGRDALRGVLSVFCPCLCDRGPNQEASFARAAASSTTAAGVAGCSAKYEPTFFSASRWSAPLMMSYRLNMLIVLWPLMLIATELRHAGADHVADRGPPEVMKEPAGLPGRTARRVP